MTLFETWINDFYRILQNNKQV